MFRYRLIVYCSTYVVLAVVCSTFTGLLAQSLPQSGPPPTTSFLAVPTGPALPTNSSAYNAAGINYPQTNTQAPGNSITQGLTQYNPIPGKTPSPAISPLADPTSTMPAQALPAPAADPAYGANSFVPSTLEPVKSLYFEEAWTWQYLPDSLLYQSYLAGNREPRFASQWIYEKDIGWMWDATLGARVGILRYGTVNSPWPEGWQIDGEGAAFPRLNLESNRDLDAADYRFGFPLTVRRGPWQGKFGYYHLSSHLGDEYMVRNHTLDRINYSRETLILGVGLFINPDLRLYTETGWAFYTDGGSRPWEFQFGIEYSPAEPTYHSPAPFFAINSRIRQEVDYSGNMTVQTGLQWRGHSGHLLRAGLQYFNGMSDMYQFFRNHEEQIGMGVWYDF